MRKIFALVVTLGLLFSANGVSAAVNNDGVFTPDCHHEVERCFPE
ncbi:hypothetical protein [Bacillus sp. SM2101]|nr:hypothetical protein [Bacillus sp. SM2101]